MAYGVLIESMIQAKNIDALNRSAISEIDVGFVTMTLKSNTRFDSSPVNTYNLELIIG